MSKVLLIFNSRINLARAVINLKFDKSVELALSELGIPKIFTNIKERIVPRANASNSLNEAQDPSPKARDAPVIDRLLSTTIPSSLFKTHRSLSSIRDPKESNP